MGHRTTLYLQSPERILPLFEANNSLPFFWLALLDSKTLKRKLRDWETLAILQESEEEEVEEEADEPPAEIEINSEIFEANAFRSRTFLQVHFPDCLPLFQGFVECIRSHFGTGDSLALDLVQFSAFYESAEAFFEALQGEIDAIEKNKPEEIKFLFTYDLIAGGTGFATSENSAFAALPEYQKNLKTRSVPPQVPQPQKANPKSLGVALVVLLLCPVFSYGIYKGYLKEGGSGSVVAIAFLNLGFYVFSLWGLLANLPKKKA